MANMPRVSTPWCPAIANVTGCRRTFASSLVNESTGSESGFEQAEFLVSFAYCVHGKAYSGKYVAVSPLEIGHEFEIQYDPDHPERNTGSELSSRPWVRTVAKIAGAVLTIVAIWFSYR